MNVDRIAARILDGDKPEEIIGTEQRENLSVSERDLEQKLQELKSVARDLRADFDEIRDWANHQQNTGGGEIFTDVKLQAGKLVSEIGQLLDTINDKEDSFFRDFKFAREKTTEATEQVTDGESKRLEQMRDTLRSALLNTPAVRKINQVTSTRRRDQALQAKASFNVQDQAVNPTTTYKVTISTVNAYDDDRILISVRGPDGEELGKNDLTGLDRDLMSNFVQSTLGTV